MSFDPAFRQWPADSLPGVLEPFLWLAMVDQYEIHGRRREHMARVQGIARGPETVGDTGADLDQLIGLDQQRFIDGLGRASREAGYRAAEDAIAAALAAGYRLAQPSEISVRVKVNRDRDTGIEVPCAECSVDLHFLFPPGRSV